MRIWKARERTVAPGLSLRSRILVAKAVGKLRAIGAFGPQASTAIDLYRGLKDVSVNDQFLARGGTELAPMSTTTDLAVAVQYAASPASLLFKIKTKSFMQRGVTAAAAPPS